MKEEMESLDIDITKAPPSVARLSELREHARNLGQQADANEQTIKRWSYGIGVVGLIIILGLGAAMGVITMKVVGIMAAAVIVAILAYAKKVDNSRAFSQGAYCAYFAP